MTTRFYQRAVARRRRHILHSKWGLVLRQLMASSPQCKTQTALARRSGVSQSTIGRILRGEVDPQTSTLMFIAGGFRIPLRTLVAAVEDKRPLHGDGYNRQAFKQTPGVRMAGVS